VILFELLTGRLPFEQDNVGDLMVAITVEGAPPLSALRPDLGEEISNVVGRALAADPNQRYGSAAELREGLLACLPFLPAGALSVVQINGASGPTTHLQLQAARSPFPPASGSVRRARRWPGVVVAGVLLASALFWLLHRSEVEPTAIPLHVQPSPIAAAPSSVRAEPIEPLAPPSVTAAASGERAEPLATDPARRDPKRARASNSAVKAPGRARATPNPPRPASPEKPQKLYRKLDF
jgi:serine/threonine-protein kinase